MKKRTLMLIFLILCVHPVFADNELDKTDGFAIKNISLAGAPLPQVLYILEELTGKSILRDSSLADVPIDLQIRKSVTKVEAIRAIESALAINHIAIVELGDGLLKAVSTKAAPAQSPQFIDYSLSDVPPSEKFCSKIFQLKYLPVGEFSKLITQLLNHDTTSAIVFEDANSILVTDSISNLQRIELILGKVDVPKHSVVESKIFRIKHGDAETISILLNKVINGQLAKNAKKIPELGFQEKFTPQSIDDVAAVPSFQFSRNITIECDVRSNSVVACGTPADIKHVESIIDQIDVLLDQVRIEVIVAQVTLGKNQATGLESFGLGYVNSDSEADDAPKMIYKKSDIHVKEAAGTSVGTLASIFSFGGNLKHFAMNTVFRKAREDSHIKILSSPTIVTTHNKEAIVKVVDSLPIIKSDISDTSPSGGGRTSMKSTIDYKDIGIELKVKPLIGANGIVQLEINQRVESKYKDVEINGNKMPATTKREAISFVSVRDGDAIVLAGLQEKSTSTNDGKIWILGDIPIIGKLLFSPKSRSEETKELVIFIKPTIVSNPCNEEAYAQDVIERSQLGDEIESFNKTGQFLPMANTSKITISDPVMVPEKKGKTVEKPRQRLRPQRPGAARKSERAAIQDSESGTTANSETGRTKKTEPWFDPESELSQDSDEDSEPIMAERVPNRNEKSHAAEEFTDPTQAAKLQEKVDSAAKQSVRTKPRQAVLWNPEPATAAGKGRSAPTEPAQRRAAISEQDRGVPTKPVQRVDQGRSAPTEPAQRRTAISGQDRGVPTKPVQRVEQGRGVPTESTQRRAAISGQDRGVPTKSAQRGEQGRSVPTKKAAIPGQNRYVPAKSAQRPVATEKRSRGILARLFQKITNRTKSKAPEKQKSVRSERFKPRQNEIPERKIIRGQNRSAADTGVPETTIGEFEDEL
ncbi:MAG: hypothetical protein LBB18_02115 [Puniceicoccales bacterium]|jgi:type II secretory pathway component GspD/PulD (secretin)|nr:hypothetical protein [Puniceicoccales bacterium]